MQPVFHEIQRFNRWWHYLIAAVPVLLTTGISLTVYVNSSSKVHTSDTLPLTIPGAVILSSLLAFFWFLSMKLETVIDAQSISVRFRGIPFCKRTIAWHDIKTVSLIDYSPLIDYGGWGVRYGMAGNGWCYNVAGNKGIKLFYQNGSPFLIGTQQADAAQKVIEYYFKS